MQELVLYAAPDKCVYWGDRKSETVGNIARKSLDEIINRRDCVDDRYYLPGDAHHAEHLVHMTACQLAVFVGSPAVIRRQNRANGRNIVRQLFKLNQLSPSVGGWRVMTSIDYPAFKFLAEYHSHGLSPVTLECFRVHPAYPAAALGGENTTAQVRLLAYLEDPRWFIDPDDPDSDSKLCQFFGLNENNAKFLLGEAKRGGFQSAYAKTVYEAAGLENVTADTDQPFAKLFLRRTRSMVPWRALLFAMEKYLSLIRQHWLQSTSVPFRTELFAADHFFAGFEEDAADVGERFAQGIARQNAQLRKM